MYGPCFSSIVGGHPLRSPTRHCLGRLLPYQLADGTQAPLEANKSFTLSFLNPERLCGISYPFGKLFHTSRQITNALLTRSPLWFHSYCYKIVTVRLACIRHTANVHPEPGSNSPLKKSSFDVSFFLRIFINEACNFLLVISYLFRLAYFYHFSVVKVLTSTLALPVFQTKTPALLLAGIGSYFFGLTSDPSYCVVKNHASRRNLWCSTLDWLV